MIPEITFHVFHAPLSVFWVSEMLTTLEEKCTHRFCLLAVAFCRGMGRGCPRGLACGRDATGLGETRHQACCSSVAVFALFPIKEEKTRLLKERLDQIYLVNERRCSRAPVYGRDLLRICSVVGGEQAPWLGASDSGHQKGAGPAGGHSSPSSGQRDLVLTLTQRQACLQDVIDRWGDLCVCLQSAPRDGPPRCPPAERVSPDPPPAPPPRFVAVGVSTNCPSESLLRNFQGLWLRHQSVS